MIDKMRDVSLTAGVTHKNSIPSIKKEIELPSPELKDTADISSQDMRKASIEYFPLHAKKRHEERETSEKALPDKTVEAAVPVSAREKTPLFITDTEDISPSITDIIKGETGIVAARALKDGAGYDVGPFEKQLSEELGELARVQNDWDIEGLKGKIPTMAEMQAVFNEVIADKSIPYEYLPDGCYARGHVAAEKFIDKDINCAKLYVMLGDVKPDNPFYPFPPYRLKAENKFTKGEWWYHVAPLTFAKNEETGKIEGYVIDPAVNSKQPIKAADWVRGFWDGSFKIQFDTTQADIYDPPMEDFNDYQPKEFDRNRFDKILPEARKTNREYSEVLAHIKEEYYAQHPDEKPENG